MAIDHYTEFKEDIKEFQAVTRQFYRKELTVPEYKHLSGGFGSYAQRGGEKSMLRLRLAGGEINQDNLQFIVDSIHKYHIDLVHFTTCQSVQFHNLSEDTVCDLISEAYEHGIITRGGGGDYPRNVMCNPLSGVEPGEYFDVLPYAKQAADYLLGFIHTVKLPRKLKVCFCNNEQDETHATFRDLGFVATKEHKFDVYIAGGLGIKPKMGLCAVKGTEPGQILYCIKAMVDVFTEYGNYENRAASRSRFLQDKLGPEELVRIYNEKLQASFESDQLDLKGGESIKEEPARMQREASTKEEEARIQSFLNHPCVIRQKQPDLFAVSYHPVGGSPRPEFFEEILEIVKKKQGIKLRIAPDQGVYIINLTSQEVPKVLELTSDGAQTEFERSTACIGAAICQVGIGNSQALLEACVERVRKEHFPDKVLPMIHISGCPSSCSAHQIGAIGFRGGKKPTPEGPQFAFAMYENGCERLGEERFGDEVGVLLATDIPEFFVDLGKEVMSHHMTYEAYHRQFPDGLREVAKKYI